MSGDPESSRTLARCLEVDPDAELPFTHGFHAYPARMHPEIARRVLEAFPATHVLDPFVGSGTVAVESVRAGLRFTGLDVSRVALEVAWARTRIFVPDDCRRVERVGHRIAGRAAALRDPPIELPPWAERDWYSPHTLREICLLKALIDDEEGDVRRLLTCVLSSLMVKLSRQTSDSDDRREQNFRPRPRGAAPRLFREKCSELTVSLLRLSSNLHKRGVKFVEPELRLEDARTAALPAVDLVLTSPPYAGTYDYARHHARRYPLFGTDAGFTAKNEIGSRRDASRYREDMRVCLSRMLASCRRVVMLIGDGAAVRADVLIAELTGGRLKAAATQRRPGGNEHLLLVET